MNGQGDKSVIPKQSTMEQRALMRHGRFAPIAWSIIRYGTFKEPERAEL